MLDALSDFFEKSSIMTLKFAWKKDKKYIVQEDDEMAVSEEILLAMIKALQH